MEEEEENVGLEMQFADIVSDYRGKLSIGQWLTGWC